VNLRKLAAKDAPLMLEWMHDESVVAHMQKNFAAKTLDDCKKFILTSQSDEKNLHLAVAAKDDTYMGTVSLKNIHKETAEFAIAMRKAAMGKGYAKYAMQEIIRLGFKDMGLKHIYWYVNPKNARAIRFYDKNGYKRAAETSLDFLGEDKILNQIIYMAEQEPKSCIQKQP
jgi:RimJ/RimL family protein N-acetyltransferase